MAVLTDDPVKQAECCRKVLALDPENRHHCRDATKVGSA